MLLMTLKGSMDLIYKLVFKLMVLNYNLEMVPLSF